MSKGKSHHQRSRKRESKESAKVSHDFASNLPKLVEQPEEVVGYMASFIAPTVVRKKLRITDEFEIIKDDIRRPRENPRILEKTIYGSQVFFFCLQHKPIVGVSGCESLFELTSEVNLFTYKKPKCRVPDCGQVLLPHKNLLVTFEINQRQRSVITPDLKDDLTNDSTGSVSNAKQLSKSMADNRRRLDQVDRELYCHTKSFEWGEQFELVQFLADWKAEMMVAGKGVPKIITTSFRETKIGSFSPAFVVRLSDRLRASEGKHQADLQESDLPDLGCQFDESLQSYARKFSSIADLVVFLRQFGGTLHVEIANKGQKQSALPIITLSGGNWLQKWIEKSKAG
jgi:hypothetical protein